MIPGTPEHLEHLIDQEINRSVAYERKVGLRRRKRDERPLAARIAQVILDHPETVRSALVIDRRRRDILGH